MDKSAGLVAGQPETNKAGILADSAPCLSSRGRTRTADPVINSHTLFAPTVDLLAPSCTTYHRTRTEGTPTRAYWVGFLAGHRFGLIPCGLPSDTQNSTPRQSDRMVTHPHFAWRARG